MTLCKFNLCRDIEKNQVVLEDILWINAWHNQASIRVQFTLFLKLPCL